MQGNQFLAIPTRYLRKVAPGIIPKALRPSSLLPPNAQFGMTYSGRFGRVGKSATPYPRTKRQNDALSSGQYAAFVQRTKSGTLCIFVRHGGVNNIRGVSDAEPWYTLIPSAHVKAVFPMDQLVQTAVDKNTEKNFDRAAAEVLTNNLLKNGFGVRF